MSFRCRRVGIMPCARGMTPALCVVLRAGRLFWQTDDGLILDMPLEDAMDGSGSMSAMRRISCPASRIEWESIVRAQLGLGGYVRSADAT